MHLEFLELYRFRNLAAQRIRFPNRVTLIIGRNGQGKTSILEAIHFLSHAKSFRTGRLRELVSWEPAASKAQDFTSAAAELETSEGRKELQVTLKQGKREVLLNGKRVESAGSFYGQLNCVVFTPDELQLVKGPPTERRSLLDRILAMSDRGYVDSLVSYQRALKSRNKVLSGSKDKRPQEITAEVTAWDSILVEHGRRVYEKRNELVSALNPLVSKNYAVLAGGQAEEAGLRFVSEFAPESTLLGPDELKGRYTQSLPRDLAQRRTTFGVHHDELNVLFDAGYGMRSARSYASQGQARSLALSVKLAAIEILKARTGEPPILLLDDVESELDEYRQEAFYELLEGFNSQVLITGTGFSLFAKKSVSDAAVLEINGGRVSDAVGPLN